MSEAESTGATAVIAHRVRDAQHADYERWLEKILPVVAAAPGYLDAQVIRPVRGLTDGYTVILRFDCEDDLRRWLTSPEREHLVDTVRPILAHGDSYTLHSGIDYLFTPQGAGLRVPVRWKQFLVTWSVILPMNLGLPLLLLPVLHAFGWRNHYVIAAAASAVGVFLMVYVIMPRYTRLVRGWLYR
jgi:antibiotic biosynthesis monooxygenase (ABM) superfamily enzyme